MIVPNVLVSISGLPKSGKNHLAYTFPEPIKVYCFNGGADFVRTKFTDKKIDIHNFIMPIVESTEMEWALPIWREFYKEYKEDATKGNYRTLVLDTATEVENICQQAVLEDLQQEKPDKEKLATTEFLRRNLLMKAIFDLARNEGVNLAALNYLKERWIKAAREKQAQNTGELVLDGWQKTETQADVNVEMATEIKAGKTVMIATIKSNRFDRDMNSRPFEDTTYNELVAVLLEGEK